MTTNLNQQYTYHAFKTWMAQSAFDSQTICNLRGQIWFSVFVSLSSVDDFPRV
jgi:hypothetical protein